MTIKEKIEEITKGKEVIYNKYAKQLLSDTVYKIGAVEKGLRQEYIISSDKMEIIADTGEMAHVAVELIELEKIWLVNKAYC